MGLGPIVTNCLIQLSWDPYPSPLRQSMLQCRMQTRLMRIGTDLVNMEMVTTDDGGCIPTEYQDFTISRFHNIKICHILVRYKDYVDVCSKDMPTLAAHISRHAKGIREDERFWLKERRKRVRGNDRVTRP